MLQGIDSFFNNPAVRRTLFRLRHLLAIALLALASQFAEPRLLWPGFVVSMFGQAIQLWSMAALVKNKLLTARGPYVLVRNPMYLGRYFLLLGFVLTSGSLWVVIGYSVLYWFYMSNRVRREEQRLELLFGESYRAYCGRVHRFLPNPAGLRDPETRFFDAGVMLRNNGHWNLLGTLLAWGGLVLFIKVHAGSRIAALLHY